MDSTRFDSLTRAFARRGNRRNLIAGSLGLATTTIGTSALAQEASPEGSTATFPDDPQSSADDPVADVMFLFVQHFESGTWVPKQGENGMYVLTLTGALASTTYFSDRPERIVGIAPTQRFLDGLGFTPENPPNAALVAHTEEGDKETLVIELFNPVYDAESQTLTYDAHILEDYGEHGLAHLAQQQEDLHLPETFTDGSLFIDSCSSRTITCHDKDTGITIGTAKSKMCFNYVLMQCVHCKTAKTVCAKTYPDRCTGDYECGN